MEIKGNGAVRSDCGTWEYVTWSELEGGDKGLCMVIGLHPVKVEDGKMEQAFEICREFARKLGYSQVALVNLYAYRGSEATGLSLIKDPIGPDNNKWITEFAGKAETIIGAWGDFPRIKPRVYEVMKLLKEVDLYCVQTNRNGSPTHPLAWRRKAPKLYRRAQAAGSLPKAG